MTKIDIRTQEGLDLLKAKAKFYGYYATNLYVLELIKEVEALRKVPNDANRASKEFGWVE